MKVPDMKKIENFHLKIEIKANFSMEWAQVYWWRVER